MDRIKGAALNVRTPEKTHWEIPGTDSRQIQKERRGNNCAVMTCKVKMSTDDDNDNYVCKSTRGD